MCGCADVRMCGCADVRMCEINLLGCRDTNFLGNILVVSQILIQGLAFS